MLKEKLIMNLLSLLLILSTINVWGQNVAPAKKDTVIWDTVPFGKYILHYTDSEAGNFLQFKNYFDKGVASVENFFGNKYPRIFNIYVFPNRHSLEKQWNKSGTKSECSMVARGVANRLDLLTPSVWKTEACDHDPKNKTEVQSLITYELEHVFQGQLNPHPDLTGMDDIRWFVEGLAVMVSGQLTKDRISRAVKTIKQGKYPQELKNAWSGDNKYGIAGLMVSYIANKYGKEKLYALLPMENQEEIMSALKTNEKDFINNWKTWALKQ